MGGWSVVSWILPPSQKCTSFFCCFPMSFYTHNYDLSMTLPFSYHFRWWSKGTRGRVGGQTTGSWICESHTDFSCRHHFSSFPHRPEAPVQHTHTHNECRGLKNRLHQTACAGRHKLAFRCSVRPANPTNNAVVLNGKRVKEGI